MKALSVFSTLFVAIGSFFFFACQAPVEPDIAPSTTSSTTPAPDSLQLSSFRFKSSNNSVAGLKADSRGLITNFDISVRVFPDTTAFLVADFSSNGNLVKIGDEVQESGVTVNNFSVPVVYSVYSASGTKVDYTVRVTVQDVYLAGFRDQSAKIVSVIDNSEATLNSIWKNGQTPGLIGPGMSTVGTSGSKGIINSFILQGTDEYSVGRFYDGSTVWIPCYWKNWDYFPLPGLSATKNSDATSIFIAGNDVYAGGYSIADSLVYTAGYWKNQVWVGLPPLDVSKNSYVYALFVDSGDVYAGGGSKNSSDVRVACYWKNGARVDLPVPNASYQATVHSMLLSDGDLYSAGTYQVTNTHHVAGYWKNSTWVALPQLSEAYGSGAYVIAKNGNDFYVGGYCADASNRKVPGYWKNGIWHQLPKNSFTQTGVVNSLAFSGGDVYASGQSSSSSGTANNLGFWKNDQWVAIDNTFPTNLTQIWSIVVGE